MPTTSKSIIFSGVQPTGAIHLGNYFGALKNWVDLQNSGKHQTVFSIVDLHALTIDQSPEELKTNVTNLGATLLALGLDPDKSIIFIQSKIKEHTELAWIFNTLTPISELERMTQFKDKSSQHKNNINAGLLNYPLLMAADILLYKTVAVPVGEDQTQHLELTRKIARKFNNRYQADFFPITKTILTKTPRLKGLDGKAKMSKSKNNYLGIFDSAEEIKAKIAKAFTDPDKLRKDDPGNPKICNLFTIWNLISSDKKGIEEIKQDCIKGKLGCVEDKANLTEALVEYFKPMRKKYLELLDNPEEINKALDAGATKAREIASTNLEEIKQLMGLK